MDAAKQPPLILEIHNWGIRVSEELDSRAASGMPPAQLFMESILNQASGVILSNEMIEAEYDDGAQVLEVYTVRRVSESIEKLFRYILTHTGISIRDMRPDGVLGAGRWDKWMKAGQTYPPIWRKAMIASSEIAVQLGIPGHKGDMRNARYAPPPKSGWSGTPHDLDDEDHPRRPRGFSEKDTQRGPNPFTSHFGGFAGGNFGGFAGGNINDIFEQFARQQRQRQQAPPPPSQGSPAAYEQALTTLGLRIGASPESIKKAYRDMARKYHPDLNPGDEAAARKMQEVNAAYDVLK